MRFVISIQYASDPDQTYVAARVLYWTYVLHSVAETHAPINRFHSLQLDLLSLTLLPTVYSKLTSVSYAPARRRSPPSSTLQTRALSVLWSKVFCLGHPRPNSMFYHCLEPRRLLMEASDQARRVATARPKACKAILHRQGSRIPTM
jgi:hypothetical protein